jgi:hypothetical protein
LADIKKRQGKKAEDARASTTDAEATVMKIGDGGLRPAFNIEFGSDTASQIIVGVDGGFPAHDQIDPVAAQTRAIAPVPKPNTRKKTPRDAAGNTAPADVQATPETTVDPYQRKSRETVRPLGTGGSGWPPTRRAPRQRNASMPKPGIVVLCCCRCGD